MNHQEFFETWEQYGVRTEESAPLVALADLFSFPISVEQDGVQFDAGVRHQGEVVPLLRCETDENAAPEKQRRLYSVDASLKRKVFLGYLERMES